MNIVQIEDYFHPDTGYQPNILSKYLQSFGHQVTIITAEMDHMPDFLTSFFGKDDIVERDRAYEQAYGIKIIRVPMWKYISGRAIYTKALLPAIRSCTPDVLFVHNNDTVVGMWATLRQKMLGYPLIMDNHMSEMASQNRFSKLFRLFYRLVFTPMIKKNHIVVIATAADRYAEKILGVPEELSPLITFGSDTMLFHPDATARVAFRKQHKISENAFVVLYAGKMDESKGGGLLAELVCQPLNTTREVVYVIVGNTVEEYGINIETCFQKSPYRVLRFQTQKYCDLPGFFQAADLALIPKQCSLSIFDLNAAGVPVLAEDNEVNVERCGHGNGWVFHAGDVNDFREKLEQIINLPQEEIAQISKATQALILKNYDYEKQARKYEQEIFNTLDYAKHGKNGEKVTEN